MRLKKRMAVGLMGFGLMMGMAMQSHGAEPVRETFTYQGVLNDGGAPANGMYDIQIQFYDELGNPFFTTVTYLDFEIVDGLMSFPIDLTNVFTFGQRRFLQVRVRPAGTATFTDLSPRQEITASPFAVYAIKAGEAETAVVAETSLDNEWDRLGTVLRAGSTGDRVLFQSDLTGGTLINSFTDLQLNFDNVGFGGMYINSENSGGSPFYGFAVDGLSEAYIEYDPGIDSIRFFNNGTAGAELELTEDSAIVKTLAAQEDIVRDFGTNDFYRQGPVAYGTIGANGVPISGTGNFTAVWEAGPGRYVISIDGETVNSSFNTMNANAISTSPAVVTTASVGGDMLVYIHSLADVNIQRSFSFTIYNNEGVVVE